MTLLGMTVVAGVAAGDEPKKNQNTFPLTQQNNTRPQTTDANDAFKKLIGEAIESEDPFRKSVINQFTQNTIPAVQDELQKCIGDSLTLLSVPQVYNITFKIIFDEMGSLKHGPTIQNVSEAIFYKSRNNYLISKTKSDLRELLKKCSPFKFPKDKYSTWREVLLTIQTRKSHSFINIGKIDVRTQ